MNENAPRPISLPARERYTSAAEIAVERMKAVHEAAEIPLLAPTLGLAALGGLAVALAVGVHGASLDIAVIAALAPVAMYVLAVLDARTFLLGRAKALGDEASAALDEMRAVNEGWREGAEMAAEKIRKAVSA